MDRDTIVQLLIEIKEELSAIRTENLGKAESIKELENDVKNLNKKVNWAHGVLAAFVFVVTIVAAVTKAIFR